MKLKKKIDKWVENELISEAQGVNILDFEKKYNNGLFGKTAATIAGILIGLGICLIVASNWDYTPTSLKILGSFGLLGAFSYNAYKNIVIKNDKLRELFLILSFLMVGATIGLFGQIFNLDGGWESFSTGWALLGAPYVFLSKSVRFNIIWCLLVIRPWKIFSYIDGIWQYFEALIVFFALSYGCSLFYDKVSKFSKLPIALSKYFIAIAYFILWAIGLDWGLNDFSYVNNDFIEMIAANIIVFGFFGGCMWLAVKKQNIDSFKRNTIFLEIYIFMLFKSFFGNLFMSGVGFILGGLAIIGGIKILKKTSKFIQNMEAFK
jgi:uncharacterized membrane protein